MNSIQEKALFHLTGNLDLSEVKEETLVTLAKDYPYFAPVQLLLSAKLKANNSHQFEKQVQKTNLYFPNPYWLHYLLTEHAPDTTLIEEVKQIENNTTEQIHTSSEIAPAPVEETILVDTPVKPESNQHGPISIPTIESVRQIMQGIDKHPVAAETAREQEPDTASPLTEHAFTEPEPVIEFIDTTPPLETEPYDEIAATELSNSKIANLLSTQLAEFKKPVKTEEKLQVESEPMHTIDYFASQGIKIDLSKIPQDKLTTQLRRFTDWLKYMKTDNPNPIDLGTHQDLEEAVELIAQTSNEPKEIVTETMAEVLQKQGQIDKAIQLYIKLSFLNPEKSAYFAAKIQHLKGIQ